MRGFEITIVIDQGLTDEEAGKTIEKYKESIVQNGGKVEFESRWGRRRLAYEIKKKNYGIYHLLYIYGNVTVTKELQTQFGYDDNILNYLIFRVDDLEDSYKNFEELKANPMKNVEVLISTMEGGA